MNKHAHGILSVQISVNYNGRPCHVLVRDPKKVKGGKDGYVWPGGEFFPAGNLFDAINRIQEVEAGAILERGSERLTNIVYSRTTTGRWIANYCVSVSALPVSEWKLPEDRDFGVVLVDSESLKNPAPEIVTRYHGNIAPSFRWVINDGAFTAEQTYLDFKKLGKYRLKIPFPDIPGRLVDTQRKGLALNVASGILPHKFQGENGFVCIKNWDSDEYALIGGKVKTLEDINSRNISAISCIAEEGGEEIGIGLHATAIVGTALTPIELLSEPLRRKISYEDPKIHSIINTCMLVRPINPAQVERLNQILESGEVPEAERDKIRGIYFLKEEDWLRTIKGKMRTPDMGPLAKIGWQTPPSEMPNLESILISPDALEMAA